MPTIQDVQNSSKPKLAVLIDADNANAACIQEVLKEIEKFGNATIRRAYGDWTGPRLQNWKSSLLFHAIQPMQQFNYTKGKNSTDSALIIDAMDILYTGNVDGFCIISSDSDFTRLACRIRESGRVVYGFGEAQTPDPFITACNRFIFTENLQLKLILETEDTNKDISLKKILCSAIQETKNPDGWAKISAVGHYIKKNIPDFTPKKYGYQKLTTLVQHVPYIEVENRRIKKSHFELCLKEKIEKNKYIVFLEYIKEQIFSRFISLLGRK